MNRRGLHDDLGLDYQVETMTKARRARRQRAAEAMVRQLLAPINAYRQAGSTPEGPTDAQSNAADLAHQELVALVAEALNSRESS